MSESRQFANLLYSKNQIDVSFLWVDPVIDNEFRHNIVKVALDRLVGSVIITQTHEKLIIVNEHARIPNNISSKKLR